MDANAKLVFAPKITITAEHAAEILECGLDTANRVLSQPETRQILEAAMHHAFQLTIRDTLYGMVRMPQESMPNRVDCLVELPVLPVANIFTRI